MKQKEPSAQRKMKTRRRLLDTKKKGENGDSSSTQQMFLGTNTEEKIKTLVKTQNKSKGNQDQILKRFTH